MIKNGGTRRGEEMSKLTKTFIVSSRWMHSSRRGKVLTNKKVDKSINNFLTDYLFKARKLFDEGKVCAGQLWNKDQKKKVVRREKSTMQLALASESFSEKVATKKSSGKRQMTCWLQLSLWWDTCGKQFMFYFI